MLQVPERKSHDKRLFSYKVLPCGNDKPVLTGQVRLSVDPSREEVVETASRILASCEEMPPCVIAYCLGGKYLRDGRMMFVDEHHMLVEDRRNERATMIIRLEAMANAPDTDPETLPCVYGCAVLFDETVLT